MTDNGMTSRGVLVKRGAGGRETETSLIESAGLPVQLNDDGSVVLELYGEHPRSNGLRFYISPQDARGQAAQWAKWQRISNHQPARE